MMIVYHAVTVGFDDHAGTVQAFAVLVVLIVVVSRHFLFGAKRK
jgi:hypothetical protein